MNQYCGDLTAAILEAVQRPYGLATAELPGYSVPQLGRMIQKLQSAGRIHRAKMGGKFGRYFDTAERADEYAKTAASRPKAKAQRFASMVAQPTGVRPVEIPSRLRDRFTPDTVPPLFSSLRPGQYIAPAPAWLEGIAA